MSLIKELKEQGCTCDNCGDLECKARTGVCEWYVGHQEDKVSLSNKEKGEA